MLGGEVGATAAAPEDDVHILVAAGLHNCGETMLGDTHERMGVRGGAHRIDSDTNLDGAHAL